MGSAKMALVAACCACALGTAAQASHTIPVLTVCETLRDLDSYTGREVIIVGRSGLTFEGAFMDEQCESDGRILIDGHRWLSMIEQIDSAHENVRQPLMLPADETRLRSKLTQVSGYADRTDTDWGDWVAVYGRIESPIRLEQNHPKSRRGRGYGGNGYGANGTVPARIREISSKTLIPGRSFVAPKRHPPQPHDLPEPPDLPIPFAIPDSPPGWLFLPTYRIHFALTLPSARLTLSLRTARCAL